jgi:hypothetical protein
MRPSSTTGAESHNAVRRAPDESDEEIVDEQRIERSCANSRAEDATRPFTDERQLQLVRHVLGA